MRLNIKVTKDIIFESRKCTSELASTNCAISLAVREIFPNAHVYGDCIYVRKVYRDSIDNYYFEGKIELPVEATKFIYSFDRKSSKQRIEMESFEFGVNLPNKVLDLIDISSLDLSKSKTLKLIE